jgi:16S rRNA (cytosine967-C5)-methyltransferase
MINIRHEAYDIIVKVLKNSEYSDNILQQRSKKLKHQDHAQISLLYQMVKGTVKYKLHLDYICRQFTDKTKYDKTDLKIKALLYLGLYQLIYLKSIPDHAAINETVELAKTLYGEGISGLVNSLLRSYQRNPIINYPAEQAERIAYEHSYPIELVKDWISQWGEEQTEMLAIFFNETPKLHIRVNTIATERHKLLQYFDKRSVSCSLSSSSNNMLICDNATDALEDVAFSEGYFSIQDTSAALIVELLDPQPGESVLDLFAAPGGKCTYIAERMQNTGEVIAVDKTPAKMKLLKQASERLQLNNIRQVVKDAFQYGPVAPAYHRVLVDAPCSGWGVMGRKADLRWQFHQNIPDLIRLQEKALSYAASFVKLNGYLVYSTCTMNPQENEQQVENFLSKNKQFSLADPKQYVPAEFLTKEGYFRTVPFKHYVDGAFAAKLVKVK